ncbi:hypothetical protein JTB14_016502 [Gonioctena quinquepunctata]|nr:hypothetical protein JTB14_016502 [Gonioctena quinquepunctata]
MSTKEYTDSSSKDEVATENTRHTWQSVKKRKRTHSPKTPTLKPSTILTNTENRFSPLETNTAETPESTNQTEQQKESVPAKPPLISIYERF